MASLIVSVLAVVVAHKALQHTRETDRATRVQSVKDEFWIRTILSEVCILPLIRFVEGLPEAVPTAGSASFTLAGVQQFWAQKQEELNAIALKFNFLGMLDGELARQVEAAFEKLEEAFCSYIDDVRTHLATPKTSPMPSPHRLREAMNPRLMEVLKLIYAHQAYLADATNGAKQGLLARLWSWIVKREGISQSPHQPRS